MMLLAGSAAADRLKPFYPGKTSDYKFASDQTAVQVPIDVYGSIIFLKAKINGSEPLWFIFDTGFEYSVIDAETADRIGLEYGVFEKDKQPGGEVDQAIADGVAIEFPGLEFFDQKVAVIPLTPLEPIVGRTINGVLGHNIFERVVVEIDYEDSMVTFYDPEAYSYSGDGEKIDVAVENGEPFIETEIIQPNRKPIKAKTKLDTGSFDVLGLNGSFVRAVGLIPVDQIKLPALGTAVGGYTENFVTRVEALRIGGIEIKNPVISYSVDTLRGGDAGTMGGEVLRRFKVVLNYPDGWMALEKNDHFDEPYVYDMSGIFPIAEAPTFDTIAILSVRPGSPAGKAGLRSGDKIISIDDFPIKKISLIQFREMMKKEGAEYWFVFHRDQKIKKAKFKLKRLI